LSDQEKILPQPERLDKIVTYMTQDDGKLLRAWTVTTAVVNADDTRVYDFATKHVARGKLFTVGTKDINEVAIINAEVATSGTIFIVAIHTHQLKDTLEITLPQLALPAEAGTVLATAVLTAIHLGIPLITIKQNLETNFSLPPGRGSIFSGISDITIIDSSYNASAASVISFLQILKSLKSLKRPTAFLFGDMKELGEYGEMEHNQVAKATVGVVDHILLIGNVTKQYVLPYAQRHQDKFKTVLWFETIKEAADYLKKYLPPKTIVLVKGSQNLEEAIKPILEDKKDAKKLCRQSPFWKAAKQKRGVWIAA